MRRLGALRCSLQDQNQQNLEETASGSKKPNFPAPPKGHFPCGALWNCVFLHSNVLFWGWKKWGFSTPKPSFPPSFWILTSVVGGRARNTRFFAFILQRLQMSQVVPPNQTKEAGLTNFEGRSPELGLRKPFLFASNLEKPLNRRFANPLLDVLPVQQHCKGGIRVGWEVKEPFLPDKRSEQGVI